MATYIPESASSHTDTSLIPPIAVLEHIEEVIASNYLTYLQFIAAKKLAAYRKRKQGIVDENVTLPRQSSSSLGFSTKTVEKTSEEFIKFRRKLNEQIMQLNLSQPFFHTDFCNPAYNCTVIVQDVDFKLPRHILSQELPKYNPMLMFAQEALPLEGAIGYEAPECNEAQMYTLDTLTLEKDAPDQAKYVLYLNKVSVEDFAVFSWALINEPDLEDESPFQESGFAEKIATLYSVATELENVRYRDWAAKMFLVHYDYFRELLHLDEIETILEAASKSPPDDEDSIALQVTYCDMWATQRAMLRGTDNTIQEAYKFAVNRDLKQLQGYLTYGEVVSFHARRARSRFVGFEWFPGPALIDDVDEIDNLCAELADFWGQYRDLPELPEDQKDLPPLVEGSTDHRLLQQIWRAMWEDGQRYEQRVHFPLAQLEFAIEACENGTAEPLSNDGMAHLACRAYEVLNDLASRLGEIKGFSKDKPAAKGGYKEPSVDVGAEEEPEFSLGPPGSFPTGNCRPRTLTAM